MSDERFDLIFEGLIAPGADRAEVRRRIGAIFKLSESGVDRLFSGRPVVVKRDVDAATADQFKTVFTRSGAILTVVAKGGAPAKETAAPGAGEGTETPKQSEPPEESRLARIDTSHLSLAPQGEMLEDAPKPPERAIDTSYLSLVPGQTWTLEDCEPPPTPVPLPDLSGLSLVPQAPVEKTASSID